MKSVDDTLDGIYDPTLINKRIAEATANYEERVLKKIMIAVGLENEIKRICQYVKDKTGKGKLTFNAFLEFYPTFPLWLSFRSLGHIYKITTPDLFNKFEQQKFTKIWHEINEEINTIKPLGVVFDFPGVKGKHMICHNWPTQLAFGTRLICIPEDNRNYTLILEPTSSVINVIKTVWAL